MKTANREQIKDIRLIAKFVEVYCNDKHSTIPRLTITLPGEVGQTSLCSECAEFMEYATNRRLNCPLEDEKPTCKHCRIHCYDKTRREKVREIMAYSGRKLLMRGRLDYLWHYFF